MSQSHLRIANIVIRYRCVGRDAVVPKSDGSVLPLDADLEVLALRDVLFGYISACFLSRCTKLKGGLGG